MVKKKSLVLTQNDGALDGIERPDGVYNGKIFSYSASQLGMMQRCPRQYYYRYRLGYKIPFGGPQLSGLGTHKAAEKSFANKVIEGDLLSIDDTKEIAADETNRLIKTLKSVSQLNSKPGELVDDSVVMSANWWKSFGHAREPLSKKMLGLLESKWKLPEGLQKHRDRAPFTGTEVYFEFGLKGVDLKVIGFIDLIEQATSKKVNVRDTKTSARRKTPADMRGPQLPTYSLAMKSAGVDVDELGFDVLVKPQKGKPHGQVQELVSEPILTPLLASTVQGYQWMSDMNQKGNYPPFHGQQCGWCGYKELCDSEQRTYFTPTVEDV